MTMPMGMFHLSQLQSRPFLIRNLLLNFNKCNTTGAISGSINDCLSFTSTEFTLVVSGVRVTQFSIFCVILCLPLFVILSFISWPLYCLLFFELRLLINPFDVFQIVVTKTDLTSGDISSKKLHSVKTSLISIFTFDLTFYLCTCILYRNCVCSTICTSAWLITMGEP
jgi:hypothetical protein